MKKSLVLASVLVLGLVQNAGATTAGSTQSSTQGSTQSSTSTTVSSTAPDLDKDNRADDKKYDKKDEKKLAEERREERLRKLREEEHRILRIAMERDFDLSSAKGREELKAYLIEHKDWALLRLFEKTVRHEQHERLANQMAHKPSDKLADKPARDMKPPKSPREQFAGANSSSTSSSTSGSATVASGSTSSSGSFSSSTSSGGLWASAGQNSYNQGGSLNRPSFNFQNGGQNGGQFGGGRR
jgi:hypothetical protein